MFSLTLVIVFISSICCLIVGCLNVCVVSCMLVVWLFDKVFWFPNGVKLNINKVIIKLINGPKQGAL